MKRSYKHLLRMPFTGPNSMNEAPEQYQLTERTYYFSETDMSHKNTLSFTLTFCKEVTF